MFTGIVREIGKVAEVHGEHGGSRLVVEAPLTAASVAIGDSIAIDGVCLTAVAVSPPTVAFQAVPETLRRTGLGRLHAGRAVNVEPALRAGDALGGHLVQGHVDGVGRVESVEWEGDGLRVFVAAPPEILRYCVEKGSITVDGVSLTVAEVGGDSFGVALVPHTLRATTFSDLAPGREVNLEVDVIAKYVEKLLPAADARLP
ncbi:MAG: riboflavin synthase [Actinobacteria bacterium]|nr:riboflavin synthase [Actinomycetota bacterium]